MIVMFTITSIINSIASVTGLLTAGFESLAPPEMRRAVPRCSCRSDPVQTRRCRSTEVIRIPALSSRGATSNKQV